MYRPPTFTPTWTTWAAASAASSQLTCGAFECARAFEGERRQAGQAVPRSRNGIEHRRQSPVGIRQGQDRREEGRYHHRLAVRDLVDRRHRRRRHRTRSFIRTCSPARSEQAHQPHCGFDQRGQRPRLAGSQPSAGLLHHVRRRWTIWRPSSTWIRWIMLLKNLHYTARADAYKFQFEKAAELMDWKKNWHPRGDSGSGPIKRGLGLATRHLGRRGACQHLQNDHPSGCFGRSGTGHAGPRHRRRAPWSR